MCVQYLSMQYDKLSGFVTSSMPGRPPISPYNFDCRPVSSETSPEALRAHRYLHVMAISSIQWCSQNHAFGAPSHPQELLQPCTVLCALEALHRSVTDLPATVAAARAGNRVLSFLQSLHQSAHLSHFPDQGASSTASDEGVQTNSKWQRTLTLQEHLRLSTARAKLQIRSAIA